MAPPTSIRLATISDLDELVRLRQVMLDSMGGSAADTGWQKLGRAVLQRGLEERWLGAVVAADPGGGMAACAIGTIEQRLPNPGNPSGLHGWLGSVATDPHRRREGLGRAVVAGLLDWFESRGVSKVSLNATPEAEPLYRSLGFVGIQYPTLRRDTDPGSGRPGCAS